MLVVQCAECGNIIWVTARSCPKYGALSPAAQKAQNIARAKDTRVGILRVLILGAVVLFGIVVVAVVWLAVCISLFAEFLASMLRG
jgi:hypothetical protein